MATNNLEMILRAMRGAVDQVERAVNGKNRRLVSKYRDVLENKLECMYSGLANLDIESDERKSFETQCNEVEKLARDAIFKADECEALMQEGEEAKNVAKVANAELDGFNKKVETFSQLLLVSPQELIADVHSDKAWGLINDLINQNETSFKELENAYVRVCQYVTDKKSNAAVTMEEHYTQLQANYVSWVGQAHRLRGLQQAPVKVNESEQGSCELKIQPLQLPVFNGEAREYARFRREFANTVEKRFGNDQVRCLYLQNQCLKGPAKDLVKSLNSYGAVIDRLDARYGKPSVIINEILRDLEDLKVSGEGEQKGLLKLSAFMQSAWDDLDAVGSLGEFCNIVTLQTIESKLLPGVQLKWATEKSKFQEVYDSGKTMVRLKEFLESECKIAENVMIMQGKVSNIRQRSELNSKEKSNKRFSGGVSETGESQFKGKNVRSCYRCGRSNHLVHDCRVPRSIVCRSCGVTGHMQKVCPGKKEDKDSPGKSDDTEKTVKFKEQVKPKDSVGSVVASSRGENVQVRLPIEQVCTEMGTCNALWDSGSTLNLVSSLWAKKHNLSGKKCRLRFNVVGGTNHSVESRLHSISLRARDGSMKSVIAYELDNIASTVIPVDRSSVVTDLRAAGIKLAEDDLANPLGDVELLLGSECLSVFPKIEVVVDKICLMTSRFGTTKYFIAGSHGSRNSDNTFEMVHSVCFVDSISVTPLDDMCSDVVSLLDDTLKSRLKMDFWSLEGLGVQPPPICNNCKKCRFCRVEARRLSLQEAKELDVIRYNLSYAADTESWSTTYPFFKSPQVLRNNYDDALRALARREAKLLKDEKTAALYHNQVGDFQRRGVLRKLSDHELKDWTGPIRYVDHRHVVKPNSTTPVRLVINSSFARKGEPSLNSILLKGPNILNCLFEILARWRTWPVAFVGDISKMYHNVRTGEVEGHVRRLLWRGYDVNRVPDTYVFQTVTFGDRPAGCIVMSALRRTAEMFKTISVEASDKIIADSYMDDVVSGSYNLESAKSSIECIQEIAGKGGFRFKKFMVSGTFSETDGEENVLGVRWRVGDDKISPSMKDLEIFNKCRGKWSRRLCWRYTSSFYDPLGLCVPVTVRMKILMKTMFLGNEKYTGWDAVLHEDDGREWDRLAADVEELKDCWVSRSCVPLQMTCRRRCCLIGFCDASMNALCACVFFKFDDGSGNKKVSLLAAKTRVTPVKQETMPRLELCGALLLSRLMSKCKSSLMFDNIETYYLCDSKIVLGQLANTGRLVNDFVGTRVMEIRAKTDSGSWAYVPTEENIADLGTRGVVPGSLLNSWFSGPGWLGDDMGSWPVEFIQFEKIEDYVFQVKKEEPLIDASKFSRLAYLHKFTAVCFMFLGSKGNGKQQLRNKAKDKIKITVESLKKAEIFWLREVNQQTVKLFDAGKYVSLRPSLVWHEQGNFAQVVTSGRVGVALKVGYDLEKLPILDYHHPYVKLLLKDFHDEEHAGDDKVVWKSRTRFWIPHARKLVRAIRKSCITCRVMVKKLAGQIMAPLPEERVLPSPPWKNVGVDLFGPFECRDVVKKRMKVKVWGIIFTCLVTRASHLDVCSTYGTDSVLQALRRFISVRGAPHQIMSDHGSQMVSCSKEVAFLVELVSWDVVEGWCASNGIVWKLVPPQAQHMNGCSEALVRVTKRVLSQRLDGVILTFEELQTVLFEVANVLNSRPLGVYARPGDDPLGGGPITPNHLLMGRATNQIPQFKYTNVNLTKRVQFIQDIVNQFWNKWHVVAFPSLVPQYKWRKEERNMCVGDVVLMRDESTSPGVFKLGQISGVKVNDDGYVRSVTVRYVKSSDGNGLHGYVTRPVHKLVVILPVEEQ